MQKNVLENFIKRYSLDGICEMAHWYIDADKQTLTAMAHTETKTVILKVVLKKWEGVETCRLAIPNSTKIRKMLSPIGDDVTITLTKVRDRIANFTVSDNDCEAVCTVAEYDAFPETHDVDSNTAEMPTEFEIEMKLTKEFIERLMKAVSALSESKDFVIVKNKKGGLDMIINYEDINTNRIRIPLQTLEGKDRVDIPMGFSTAALKSILSVNEITPDSILKISNRGVAVVSFEDDSFKSTYFLFPTRLID